MSDKEDIIELSMNGENARNQEAENVEASEMQNFDWEHLIVQLSALYALMLVIFAIASELSELVSSWKNSYEWFAIYIYSVSIAFLVYCYLCLMRKANPDKQSLAQKYKFLQLAHFKEEQAQHSKNYVRHASHSAPMTGSMYLRLGCVLFGTVAVIFCALMAYVCLAYHVCLPLDALSEVLLAVFIFIQMYFIFENSKLAIHRRKNICRFGFMHIVATNLCLWVKVLFLELFHVFMEITAEGHGSHKDESHGSKTVHPDNSTQAMHNASGTTTQAPISDDSCSGVGCFLQQTVPFVFTCVIEYTLICAAVNFVMWRNIGSVALAPASEARKRQLRVDCQSSTRGLFAGLLYFSASVVSLVVFSSIDFHNETALLLYNANECLLYVAMTAVCLAGLWRMRRMTRGHAKNPQMASLDQLLLVVGLVGQLCHSVFGIVMLSSEPLTAIATALLSVHAFRMLQVLAQAVFITHSEDLVVSGGEQARQKPGRKDSLSSRLVHLYGKNALGIVLNSAVPLTIFFRFHSTVCLADIWKHGYQLRE